MFCFGSLLGWSSGVLGCFWGVFVCLVGGGVVVYRLCGFWLGGGGGFAFWPFLYCWWVVLVGSLVVSLVWVWGVCQVVTGLVGLGLSAS